MKKEIKANPDDYVRGKVTKNPDLLIPHYLMHSWLYYEMDSPLIGDNLYDEICHRLEEKYFLLNHPHLNLIDQSSLAAGTGYSLSSKYPLIAKCSATQLKWRFGHELNSNFIPYILQYEKMGLKKF